MDNIVVGAIFASRPSVAFVIFFGLESHIGKIPFLFLPYKAWANGVRVPLVCDPTYIYIYIRIILCIILYIFKCIHAYACSYKLVYINSQILEKI